LDGVLVLHALNERFHGWAKPIEWVKSILWDIEMSTHQYTVHVDQRGRLVLPADVRHRLRIDQGSTLILAVQDDGALRLISAGEAAHSGRGLLRVLAPKSAMDRRLAEELIAERHHLV